MDPDAARPVHPSPLHASNSEGLPPTAEGLATALDDAPEPRVSRAGVGELAVWGSLLLRVAAAAARDNRPGEADDALRLAAVAATAMGHETHLPGDWLRTFGPISIMLEKAEHAAIIDRPDLVLKLADHVPTSAAVMPTTSNINRHHRLDVPNTQSHRRSARDGRCRRVSRLGTRRDGHRHGRPRTPLP